MDSADDVLEVLLRRADVEDSLVDSKFEVVEGVGTVTARGLASGDVQSLGGHSADSGGSDVGVATLEALDLLLNFADSDLETLGVLVSNGQLEVEDGVLVDLLDFLIFLVVVVFLVSHQRVNFIKRS